MIFKLAEKSQGHIPYRDSKLTRILQNSLSGRAYISIICCLSPSTGNIEESIQTIKFAARAKKIKNEVGVNEKFDQATLLEKYREEIERLKESSVDILSAHTEAQMNAGIVAALILSFMVPLSLEPIEASDDCVDFFSRDAVHYLKYLSIFFTLLANVSCIATIILAVRFGVYVNWIASALGRTLFVSTLDARLFPELQMLTLTTLQFAMIFRGALAGPLQGLAGIITYIMYNVFLHGAENSAGARAHNIQLKLVKDMFAEKPSSII